MLLYMSAARVVGGAAVARLTEAGNKEGSNNVVGDT